MADVESLVAAVLATRKYGAIAPEFVRKVAADELKRHPKDALKATKNRLHQVAGAYLSDPPKYDAWLERLQAASADERPAVCRALMQTHASTRERLPILDEFYATIFADLPPIHSVLDVACGLNPLAIPLMPLAPDAVYYATDLYTDQAVFFNAAFPLLGMTGLAWASDVTQVVPDQRVQLALVLKSVACLQQIDKGIGLRLLEGIHADHVLVSYPVHSLGGAGKGMRANYEAQFRELIAGTGWTVRRYDFATELAFLVSKPDG